MTAVGLAMGGNARTGLEDTLTLRRGVATSNRELVERLVAVANALECGPADPSEVEARLRLRPTPVL
jgi:3-keto-5-aminohexanoate cleavage enzyme